MNLSTFIVHAGSSSSEGEDEEGATAAMTASNQDVFTNKKPSTPLVGVHRAHSGKAIRYFYQPEEDEEEEEEDEDLPPSRPQDADKENRDPGLGGAGNVVTGNGSSNSGNKKRAKKGDAPASVVGGGSKEPASVTAAAGEDTAGIRRGGASKKRKKAGAPEASPESDELVDGVEETWEAAHSGGKAVTAKKAASKRAKKSVKWAADGSEETAADDDSVITPVRAKPPPNAPIKSRTAASRTKAAAATATATAGTPTAAALKKQQRLLKFDQLLHDDDDVGLDAALDQLGVSQSLLRRLEARFEQKHKDKVTDEVAVDSCIGVLELVKKIRSNK